MGLRVLVACGASLLPLLELGGFMEGRWWRCCVWGVFFVLFFVGANCNGWVVCLGWGRIAGCQGCVLCSVRYCTGALVV